MLYKSIALLNYKLGALDGEIGKVKDFYFDDKYWTVRYIVADTGNWLRDRKVLISPHALVNVNENGKIINTKLTKQQIENSPSIDTNKPVSRQFEEIYHKYYGWHGYWYGPYVWGPFAYPPDDSDQLLLETISKEKKWNPHLRSVNEVNGYHIHAKDGDIGHVYDFMIYGKTWRIHYLIVDTRNVLHGKKVLISTKWIKRVSWSSHEAFVTLSRDKVKQSPEYNDAIPMTCEYEEDLCKHYDRENYWNNIPLLGL